MIVAKKKNKYATYTDIIITSMIVEKPIGYDTVTQAFNHTCLIIIIQLCPNKNGYTLIYKINKKTLKNII